jgi:diacylglycerol kinase family enzyme
VSDSEVATEPAATQPTREDLSPTGVRFARAPDDANRNGDDHDPATERKRLMIIVNPYATTVSDRLRHLVVYALAARYDVEAVDTQAQGHATALARDAARDGFDVVVAFGGDGTVNEAANGLVGSRTALTCLPGGSANVFNKILGIPGDLVDATEHVLGMADRWAPRRVDIGVVNGRHFTFSSGLGLDASVTRRVDARPHLKARYGPWFFTWAAMASFHRDYLIGPPRMITTVGDETFEGVTTLVQNASPFTYFRDRPIEVADGADLQSGTLAGAILRRASPLDMPSVTWRAFSRRARIDRHRQVSSFANASSIVVRSADDRPLPLQVDGDYLGEVDEARYSIEPGRLLVVS